MADLTPGASTSARSTAATHAAHVIPVTERSTTSIFGLPSAAGLASLAPSGAEAGERGGDSSGAECVARTAVLGVDVVAAHLRTV